MTARTVQQLFDLTGRRALVTGGSRGFGLQMAHALGEAGATVVISSRKARTSSMRLLGCTRPASPPAG
jgi:NAD(P)-dependent dehydrogenase (short-subunit alcohol dehydrogenase family)